MNPPRLPFDPELEAVLAALADQFPSSMTAEMIPLLRESDVRTMTDEQLAASDLTRRDVTIPGFRGDAGCWMTGS
ncbi:hypothetical protein DQ392_31625 [Streptomyces reniochalinae]|uniref:Uncharacterized protein n=1 Tax=Streptomyces reniochalinae TaxID=2250578 RepID=A0A367E6I7_9ACTN|nr:hypothetical protein DQ392_31625 [Streptomyces reniochalinae]